MQQNPYNIPPQPTGGPEAAPEAPHPMPLAGAQSTGAQHSIPVNSTPPAAPQKPVFDTVVDSGAPYTPNPGQQWTPYGAGAHYGHAPQPGTGPQQSGQAPRHTKAKKGPNRVAAAVALVLACGVFSFGGNFAANQLTGSGGAPVVYKVPEGSNINPASASSGLSVSEIAAKAGQSVVSVATENTAEDPFLGSQTYGGAGSGVIMTENGYIITNHHVVDGANQVRVTLPDGSEHDATVIGSDARSDIAVLKINVNGLVPAVFGDNEQVRVGDFCLAIGNPMGTLGGTVTDGIISALNREVNISGTPMNLLQMSAAVSPGNSGGGLFNANGELVGIVNAKAGSENTEALGFSIPANTALQVAEQLMEDGYVKGRPALGITAEQVNIGGTAQTAVVIARLTEGSAAAQAGLQEGDMILSVGGTTVTTLAGLTNMLDTYKVGDEIDVEVLRGEETLTLQVTLQELVPEPVPVSGA